MLSYWRLFNHVKVYLDIYLWVVSELWRNGGELADSQAILRAQKMAGKRGGPMWNSGGPQMRLEKTDFSIKKRFCLCDGKGKVSSEYEVWAEKDARLRAGQVICSGWCSYDVSGQFSVVRHLTPGAAVSGCLLHHTISHPQWPDQAVAEETWLTFRLNESVFFYYNYIFM